MRILRTRFLTFPLLIGSILVFAVACGSDPVTSPQPEAQAVSGSDRQAIETQSGASSQGDAMTTLAQDSATDAMAKNAGATDAMAKNAGATDAMVSNFWAPSR